MAGPSAIDAFLVTGSNVNLIDLGWRRITMPRARGGYLVERDKDLARCVAAMVALVAAAFRPLDFAQAIADYVMIIER
jgi:hypothetical protein